MFTIKKLLKISLVVFITTIIFSCRKHPYPIDEDRKSAFGYYAYNKGDSVKMIVLTDKDTDTISLFVADKEMSVTGLTFVYYEPHESYKLSLVTKQNINLIDYLEADTSIIINLIADVASDINVKMKKTLISLGTSKKHSEIHFYDKKEIDGKTYDSVYYWIDTFLINRELTDYMYSSKRYGFIKLWNDTVTIKFER